MVYAIETRLHGLFNARQTDTRFINSIQKKKKNGHSINSLVTRSLACLELQLQRIHEQNYDKLN